MRWCLRAFKPSMLKAETEWICADMQVFHMREGPEKLLTPGLIAKVLLYRGTRMVKHQPARSAQVRFPCWSYEALLCSSLAVWQQCPFMWDITVSTVLQYQLRTLILTVPERPGLMSRALLARSGLAECACPTVASSRGRNGCMLMCSFLQAGALVGQGYAHCWSL